MSSGIVAINRYANSLQTVKMKFQKNAFFLKSSYLLSIFLKYSGSDAKFYWPDGEVTLPKFRAILGGPKVEGPSLNARASTFWTSV